MYTNLLQEQDCCTYKFVAETTIKGETEEQWHFAGPFSHKLLRKSQSQAGLVDFSVYTLSSSQSAAFLRLRNWDFLQSPESLWSANMMLSFIRINEKEIWKEFCVCYYDFMTIIISSWVDSKIGWWWWQWWKVSHWMFTVEDKQPREVSGQKTQSWRCSHRSSNLGGPPPTNN